jgi:large subunit ribosomal protein L21
MHAVIKTGGKQYRVADGQTIKVESLEGEVGAQLTLDQVLSISDGTNMKVGTPLVEGAVVKVTVVSQGRHPKVRIFKMQRRKHYQRRAGHRQNFTELRIDSIG